MKCVRDSAELEIWLRITERIERSSAASHNAVTLRAAIAYARSHFRYRLGRIKNPPQLSARRRDQGLNDELVAQIRRIVDEEHAVFLRAEARGAAGAGSATAKLLGIA